MTVFIYVLKEPLTGQVRYVGATRDKVRRLQCHLGDAKRKSGIKHLWVRGLLAQNLTPIFEILDEVDIEESPMWEAAYIDFFKGNGCDLLNINRGVKRPMSHSEETKRKIGAANIGNTHALGIKRPTMTPEHRAKISKTKLGLEWSDGMERARLAKIGAKLSPETRAKMSAANTGKPWSETRRANYNKKRAQCVQLRSP